MEISDLVIRIIILLLPGLICMSLIKALIHIRSIDNREYYIYIIISSFASYFMLYIISIILGLNDKITFFDALLDTNILINKHEILYASIIACILGIAIATIVNKGIFYSVFQKIRVTNRTGSNSTWEEFINAGGNGINGFVYVIDFQEDLVYGGEVLNYSSVSEKSIELVLLDVIVTKNSNRKKIIRKEIEKVYLKLPQDKIYIEFRGEKDGKESRKKRSKSTNTKNKK